MVHSFGHSDYSIHECFLRLDEIPEVVFRGYSTMSNNNLGMVIILDYDPTDINDDLLNKISDICGNMPYVIEFINKSNNEIRSKVVPKWDITTLANTLGDLRYDVLTDLFEKLIIKLESDSFKDNAFGRHELSTSLNNAAKHIRNARQDIYDAWIIEKNNWS